MKYKIHNVSLLFYFSQLTFKKLRKEKTILYFLIYYYCQWSSLLPLHSNFLLVLFSFTWGIPIAYLVVWVYWQWSLLAFAFVKTPLIYFHFWKIFFTEYILDSFFVSINMLFYFCQTSVISDERVAILFVIVFFYVIWLLAAFEIVCLIYNNLTNLCLELFSLVIILLEFHWASWICGFYLWILCFIKLGAFLAINSSVFLVCSLLSTSGTF